MQISDTKSRMTPEDVAVLKAMFEDREGAVEVIRKIFFPELRADNPLFQNNDLYTQGFSLDGLSGEDKVIMVEARHMLVKHIEGALSVMRALIGKKDESPEQVLERLQKDSSK
jgi:hypothetical protein